MNLLYEPKLYAYLIAAKKENQVRKLKEDKSRLEAEIETLERKVERMSTMQKQVKLILMLRTCVCIALQPDYTIHYV